MSVSRAVVSGELTVFANDYLFSLKDVPTIVITHTFCASPDTRISYH